MLGVLARLGAGHSGDNQLLVEIPLPDKPFTPPGTKSISPFAIEQKATTSWDFRGTKYYRYSAMVTNKSSKIAKNLNISISKFNGELWGLTKLENGYYPTWVESLPAVKNMALVPFKFVKLGIRPRARLASNRHIPLRVQRVRRNLHRPQKTPNIFSIDICNRVPFNHTVKPFKRRVDLDYGNLGLGSRRLIFALTGDPSSEAFESSSKRADFANSAAFFMAVLVEGKKAFASYEGLDFAGIWKHVLDVDVIVFFHFVEVFVGLGV
ncbi:uncharacterized protein A4U43_C05F11960 [Asparagus officinalis]|uniref:Carbohydrate binding domain-containing protein n=1 Tax=Asparagus officinalis TaxID=4686 RepID=A0A5P1EUS2_ASPOF|nr:uncharacterized protein A4U43_C05F11960 [Asparagus officinalis]